MTIIPLSVIYKWIFSRLPFNSLHPPCNFLSFHVSQYLFYSSILHFLFYRMTPFQLFRALLRLTEFSLMGQHLTMRLLVVIFCLTAYQTWPLRLYWIGCSSLVILYLGWSLSSSSSIDRRLARDLVVVSQWQAPGTNSSSKDSPPRDRSRPPQNKTGKWTVTFCLVMSVG